MACTICTKSFGFFNKEHGCPVCKFSFCSGCLRYKLVRDGKKLNVCLRCSKLASEPPKKENTKHVPPVTATNEGGVSSPKRSEPQIRSPIEPPENPTGDELIRSKLEALKANDPEDQQEPGSDPPPTTGDNSDIERRLAALKGVEYRDYKDASQRFMAPDNRTAEQQVQDLLGQFVEETKLINVMDDKRAEQDEEIVKRLNALKEFPTAGETVAPGSGARPPRTTLPDSDSDEEGRLEAKLHLDDALEEEPSGPSASGDLGEELPWCTICNEDAVLRCRGCDNDLYCRGCYKEFHYDEDPNEHPTVPFKGGGKGVKNG
uniref:Uncharacterized protein n=1 Tax=Anopheles stephensi TaxID=30069 RepID=A0A182YAQ1_ANOST